MEASSKRKHLILPSLVTREPGKTPQRKQHLNRALKDEYVSARERKNRPEAAVWKTRGLNQWH